MVDVPPTVPSPLGKVPAVEKRRECLYKQENYLPDCDECALLFYSFASSFLSCMCECIAAARRVDVCDVVFFQQGQLVLHNTRPSPPLVPLHALAGTGAIL